MNSKNIVIGDYYRHRGNEKAWAKVLAILPPRKGLNTHTYWIAKCEWTINKDDLIGLIKYFRLSDLQAPIPNLITH